ncbi:MAG: hypothetical protein K2L16_00770, partial [Muribaculaceae bacterium]|nr:hypothetical protein [Muribaculaceae bacterium]
MQGLYLFITLIFVCTATLGASAADGITQTVRTMPAGDVGAALPELPAMYPPDSLSVPAVPRQEKKNLIGKIVDYFQESNKEHKSHGFDISFIGGPYYSTDTKFG